MESYRVLIRPLVTEKSNFGPQRGQYTFVVNQRATKDDIKKAVEERFKVNVVNVRTAIFLGKEKGRGATRVKGKKPDWKKAYVTIQSGQTIVELYEDLG
jgi:large subunit ribosomal protein L23